MAVFVLIGSAGVLAPLFLYLAAGERGGQDPGRLEELGRNA